MITNQMLATYPFLSRLSAESRQLLDTGAKVRTSARGECLLRPGDRIDGLYLVLSGRLRVYAVSPAGDEASLYGIEPGDSCPLALNALLRETLHPAWVEVETKSAKMLLIPALVFRDLYENERAVREFALGVLSGRISSLMTALAELSLQPLGERLRQHLVRQADPRGEVETTHEKIARALGTAREVVSRKLRELSRAGLIKTRRGRITILQTGRLG